MKVQTYVETCQPGESPRFGFAKPPPFGKGGFVLSTYCTAVTIPGAGGAVTICRRFPCEIVSGNFPQRLPCQRELAPEATEGFTAGTFQKYKPMWKLASLRNPPASAQPRHPPLARGALVRCLDFHPVTLPGTGGAVTIRRRFPCALSAATRRMEKPR